MNTYGPLPTRTTSATHERRRWMWFDRLQTRVRYGHPDATDAEIDRILFEERLADACPKPAKTGEGQDLMLPPATDYWHRSLHSPRVTRIR